MKIKRSILVIILIIATILGACAPIGVAPLDGDVLAVQTGTTIWGMRQAILEKTGTMLMQKENLTMFMWSLEDGWAFSVINTNSRTAVADLTKVVGPGNFVNCKTMADLTEFLKSKGWEVVGASQVPRHVTSALTGGATWLTQMAQSMTSFLVVPAGVFEYTLPEGYEVIVQ